MVKRRFLVSVSKRMGPPWWNGEERVAPAIHAQGCRPGWRPQMEIGRGPPERDYLVGLRRASGVVGGSRVARCMAEERKSEAVHTT